MPEFRKDQLTDRWVIISPERAQRPRRDLSDAPGSVTDCPFCAGNESMTPPAVLTYFADEVQPGRMNWSLRVVPNKFPAVVDQGNWMLESKGIYQSGNGIGIHEVIIESPQHLFNVQSLDEAQFKRILHAYKERIAQLRTDKRWRCVAIYKNQGPQAGATLDHVHSQLVALPIVPKGFEEEIANAKRHYESTGDCVYCRMIDTEIREQTRIVLESDRFIVVCPFASRFSYETWILPKQHNSSFDLQPTQNYPELARALREILIRIGRRLESPSFNYILYTNRLDEDENGYYHWYIAILPKLTQAAAFEWGFGAHMNSVAPEEAARLLRDVAL
jgi:UDPglucose--hexose-1-phosphate uridylyltransferase